MLRSQPLKSWNLRRPHQLFNTVIAEEVRQDIAGLIDALSNAGYAAEGTYDAKDFGNWYVDVAGPRQFRLIKDRRQYLIDGPEDSLRAAGLWRAFNSREEFQTAVLRWAVG